MIDIGTVLRHYKRLDIQEEIVRCARDREVAVKYGDKGFGKRPDTLTYPKDIIEFAKQRATSFHVSEEHWSNALSLSPELRTDELDALRTGWDLVLDIDCYFWEYSKLTAKMLIQALRHHGIRSISCKFSGNKGFHIAVPYQAFPVKLHGKDTRLFFPEGAKRIALYLNEFIRERLSEEILKTNSVDDIMKTTGRRFDEIIKNSKFDPFSIIDIDTLLISSRHLYRMPYSLHEKSGLCSIPIDPDRVMEFDKQMAEPDDVKVSSFRFLDTSGTKENEARDLILQAFDFSIPQTDDRPKRDYDKEFEELTSAIPADFFPPCIHNILKGIEDGRKRSMFILINFFSNTGYDYDRIDELLHEWNKRNREQLREVNIRGQVRYRRMQKQKVLPPNCDNLSYYKNFGVCTPDNFCPRIKNPVNYAVLKARIAQGNDNKGRQKLTDEQKDMRRKYRERVKEGSTVE